MSLSFFKNKKLLSVLKLMVSLVLVIWLIFSVHWAEVWKYLKDIDPFWLALYVALIVVGIGISARKWQVLTRDSGFQKSYGWHFQTYLTGTFINNFLPSIVGGDTYRALALGKVDGEHRSPAVSSVLFDRLSGLWTFALMAFLFALPRLSLVAEHSFWTVCIAGLFVFLLLNFALAPKRSRLYIMQYLPFQTERFKRLTDEITARTVSPKLKNVLAYAAAFSFVGVGLANFALFRALGSDVGLVDFLSVIFLINIIAAIPVSVNNIGIKEWAYYVFFGFLGLDPALAVTAAIVSRFIQMIISFFALPGYLRGRNK